jgi:hypothetical protein
MPNTKNQVSAEIFIELQIATAKAIRCIEHGDYALAGDHLRSCNPFLKAIELDGRIADLDAFIGTCRVSSH